MTALNWFTAALCSNAARHAHTCVDAQHLIRTDVQATVWNCPIEDVDIQEIEVWLGNEKFKVYNFYCPPPSKTEIAFKEVVYKKTIMAGDFNAHLPSLGYSSYNKRGHMIEDLLNSSNLCLMQSSESEATLFHKRHKTLSRPDLTLISSDIVESATFTTPHIENYSI